MAAWMRAEGTVADGVPERVTVAMANHGHRSISDRISSATHAPMLV
jgi:hypothetical protein